MSERDREVSRLRRELDSTNDELQHSMSMKRMLEDRVRSGSPTKGLGDTMRLGTTMSSGRLSPFKASMRL